MLGLALRRTAIAAGVMASDRSNLRQELASVAAVTAGVSGTPRPPGFRSGGEGEDALDQKRHDRSSARPRANVKATHVWTRLKSARSEVQRRKPVCTFDGWSEVKEEMLCLLR